MVIYCDATSLRGGVAVYKVTHFAAFVRIIDMAGNGIQIEGFIEQRKELEQLLTSNPEMEKKIQAIVRKALALARRMTAPAARSAMNSDPRQSYKAVRSMVYRQILGGNINILNKKRAGGGGNSYEPVRTLQQGQRGGNRRPRSQRTEQIDSYSGGDRGFILRFVNDGTSQRSTKYGNRGAITARNWFGASSQAAIDKAVEFFSQQIDQLIKQTINNG